MASDARSWGVDDHPLRRPARGDPRLVESTWDIPVWRQDHQVLQNLRPMLSLHLGRPVAEDEMLGFVLSYANSRVPRAAKAHDAPPPAELLSYAETFRAVLGACLMNLEGFLRHAKRIDAKRAR